METVKYVEHTVEVVDGEVKDLGKSAAWRYRTDKEPEERNIFGRLENPETIEIVDGQCKNFGEYQIIESLTTQKDVEFRESLKAKKIKGTPVTRLWTPKDLQKEINNLEEGYLKQATIIGNQLCMRKRELSPDKWLLWVEAKFPDMTERQLQYYMDLSSDIPVKKWEQSQDVTENQPLYTQALQGDIGAQAAKVIEFSHNSTATGGWIKPSQVTANLRPFRQTKTEDIKTIFKDLAAQGIGTLRGTDFKMEWKAT